MIAVLLAEGFEEIEALGTVDFLRRCGLDVKTYSIDGKQPVRSFPSELDTFLEGKQVTGAHGISVLADERAVRLPLDNTECLVLPGGMPGTVNLARAQELIEHAYQNNLLIAAICAAPSILAHLQLLDGKKATCYPGYEEELRDAGAIVITDQPVVEDGNLITSRGAGTVFDFAEAIAARFVGKDKAAEVRSQMIA
ncbi:MAG: DJ-1/PfpI family protein [Oscillospiraceae bacterium]|jgi:4-methyl-5(b-hydroxyethyl)-thiazole monophosphate biosynthesis|nr:DJ-1/PfpI family protein [Oscillospiraceae bacterium]